jgi:HEAT repeat protein
MNSPSIPLSRPLATRPVLERCLALLQALALALFGAGLSAPATAQGAAKTPSLDEDAKTFQEDGDRAAADVIARLAKSGDAKYCKILLEGLPLLKSDGGRLRLAKQLWRLAGVGGVEQDAMQALMDLATTSEREEVSQAALDSLSKSERIGRQFLAMIVDSSAADELRIGAMRRHIKSPTAEDRSWYRRLWKGPDADEEGKDKKKPKKEDKLSPEEAKRPWDLRQVRALAFGTLVSDLEVKDLQEAAGDGDGDVRRAAVAEMLRRDVPETKELAQKVFGDGGQTVAVREAAADWLMRQQGEEFGEALVAVALHFETPSDLRRGLAAVFAARANAEQKEKLAKKFGKGKPEELQFGIRALTGYGDAKIVAALEKLLRDKDSNVRAAAIEELAKRGQQTSVEPLEKAIDKLEDPVELAAILRALSGLRGTDPAWAERLRGFATGEAEFLRNASIGELVRLRDEQAAKLVEGALVSPAWSTRLAAAQGVEVLRLPEGVGWIVAQLQQETGRMARELTDILFRMTGQPYGKNAGAWKNWHAQLSGPPELISQAELDKLIEEQKERSLDETTGTRFFGLRIESHRVCFVIDTSGSMEEKTRGPYTGMTGPTRMEAAKTELKKALDGLDPNALFNIVTFSDKPRPWQKVLQRATPEVIEQAKEHVTKLVPSGGTNLFGGIQTALQDPDVDTIIFLGDGEPSVGEIIEAAAIRRWVAGQNRDRGVKIHTVRVGLDLPILQWLSEDSGGTSIYIP